MESNDINIHLKKLGKKQRTKLKESRRKKITKSKRSMNRKQNYNKENQQSPKLFLQKG